MAGGDGGARNPFVGPRPFDLAEAGFHGRDTEVGDLLSLVFAARILVLYAASGAGKTSLLNAGLVPALVERDFCVPPVARVGGALPEGVDEDGLANAAAFTAVSYWTGGEDAAGDVTLSGFLATSPPCDGSQRATVLVFDQFEELFTARPDRWQDRAGFMEQLVDVLRADATVRVVLSLREDYLAELSELLPPVGDFKRRAFRLERLREPAALEALVEPLARTGLAFADGVAEKLIAELRKTRHVRNGRTRVIEGEFVEPVQLQVVGETLWANVSPTQTRITEKHLERYGNVDEALTEYYRTAVGEAARQSGVRERHVRRFVDLLITDAGTRGTVIAGEEETGGLANRAVAALEDLHIVRGETQRGHRWYELTHDRFVDPIRSENARSERHFRRRWSLVAAGVAVVMLVAVTTAVWLLLRDSVYAMRDLSGADLSGRDLRNEVFAGSDLTGADLTAADLTGADFVGADLTDAHLTAADLTGALLGKVTLQGATLVDATLVGADLSSADLSEADLSGADLTLATLEDAQLAGVTLAGTTLAGNDLSGAELQGVDLRGADLTGTSLEGADLAGAELTGAKVAGAQFLGADLEGADLAGVDLSGEALVGANLIAADLTGAHLTRADLTGSLLSDAMLNSARLDGADLGLVLSVDGADFTNASLVRARLAGADGPSLAGVTFTGAVLTEADLAGADLAGAQLDGAFLFRADLSGASLVGAQLEGAALLEADLRGADLQDATLRDADLIRADLTGATGLPAGDLRTVTLHNAILPRALFRDVDLTGLQASGVDLTGSLFQAADLSGADLAGARLDAATFESALIRRGEDPVPTLLRGASLAGAMLKDATLEADLTGADLSGAVLAGADLRAADLTDVDLRDADLEEAVLTDVILDGAVVAGARVRGADLSGVTSYRDVDWDATIWDAMTVWPDGFAPTAAEVRAIATIGSGAMEEDAHVAVGFGAAWVSDPSRGHVRRLDPVTGEKSTSPRMFQRPGPIAIGGDLVWVADVRRNRVPALDPASALPSGREVLADRPRSLAATADALWIAAGDGLLRLDFAAEEVARVEGVPAADLVHARDGLVWVAANDEGVLYRLDPATGAVGELPLEGVADDMAVTGDVAWYVDRRAGAMWRADAAAGEPPRAVDLDGLVPVAVAADENRVFVATKNGVLAQVDAATGALDARHEVPGRHVDVAFADGQVWVHNLDGNLFLLAMPPPP